MIEFQGKLCYSPQPPTKYAKLSNGIPVGPAAVAVDRAIGSPILKKHGIDGLVETGLHIWNLAWLISPEFDKLPKLRIANYPENVLYTSEQWGEIILFAASFEEDLLGPPVAFLKRVQKMKIALPVGYSFGKAMKRALKAEGLDVVRSAANVMVVDFRQKRA